MITNKFTHHELYITIISWKIETNRMSNVSSLPLFDILDIIYPFQIWIYNWSLLEIT